MSAHTYDIIVIGGGAAGLVAAKLARGFNKKVALIEKHMLGGTCTLTGCIPSKALIHIADSCIHAHGLQQFTADTQAFIHACTLDTARIMTQVQNTVNQVYSTHTPEKLTALGITVLFGSPRFINSQQIVLNNQVLTARKYILATGTRPVIPDTITGLATVPYLTNESFFALKTLPRSLLILGGGAFGIEMASCLVQFGVAVTVVEQGDTILARNDQELVYQLTEHLIQQGVQIKTGFAAQSVSYQNNQITLACRDSAHATVTLQAEQLLLATGRAPNIENLGLEDIAVTTNKQGVIVDKTLKTTQKTIYACGDVVGPHQFSHMAEYQAVIAVRNALIPVFKRTVNYNHVVWVTFTLPELASAGITEEQAYTQYSTSIRVYKRAYTTIDRGITDNVSTGLAKFICTKRGIILGAHILGNRAGELIHEIQLGKYYNIPLDRFYQPIHAYPSYSDSIWQTAKQAYIDRLHSNTLVQLLQFFTKINHK